MAAPSSPALPAASIDASSSLRQQEQLRRFLYPSLTSTDSLPRLLPLSQIQEADPAWIRLDLECQLLLAQILRVAVQPWYSKLTNDRELNEEVVEVVRYSLQRVKNALLQKTGNMTRLERFLLYDVPHLIQLQYIEVRRATAMSTHQEDHERAASAAAVIFLASNPNSALSISDQSQLLIDEAYLDVLLIAILQGTLPPDHLESHNETLIIIDVLKGIFRGQARVHGSGAWVIVRALLSLQSLKTKEMPSLTATSSTKGWYHRANVLFGLNIVYAVIKTLFFYLAVFYLDLFTPLAEPRKRTRRRKAAGVEADAVMECSLNPVLDTIVEALQWRSRLTTRFIEEWLRIALTWGGNHLIERQAKESFTQLAQPEQISIYLAKLLDVLVAMPHQSPPEPIQEPTLAVQKQELDRLVAMALAQMQHYPPIALLLGHDESTQKQSIEGVLLPFSAPPLESHRCSVVQVANAKLLLALLECFALLVNPALE
jgi:hypothetical protein